MNVSFINAETNSDGYCISCLYSCIFLVVRTFLIVLKLVFII